MGLSSPAVVAFLRNLPSLLASQLVQLTAARILRKPTHHEGCAIERMETTQDILTVARLVILLTLNGQFSFTDAGAPRLKPDFIE